MSFILIHQKDHSICNPNWWDGHESLCKKWGGWFFVSVKVRVSQHPQPPRVWRPCQHLYFILLQFVYYKFHKELERFCILIIVDWILTFVLSHLIYVSSLEFVTRQVEMCVSEWMTINSVCQFLRDVAYNQIEVHI